MGDFRVGLAQINPTVGDLDGNLAAIVERLEEAEGLGCDLVAFPELALPGYPPEDLVLRPRFVQDNLAALEQLRAATAGKQVAVVVGFVDLDGDLFNAAAVLHDGALAGVYRKRFLPNYGVFDEARYFRPGQAAPVFTVAGVGVGVNICEDIWYASGPAQEQALAGAAVIVNINGSPFHVNKIAMRERMLSTRASDNAVIVCYCNMVGGQDSLIFDGGSMIHDVQGKRIAAAPMFEETLLVADLDVEAGPAVPVSAVPVSAVRAGTRAAISDPPQAAPLREEAAVYEALVLGTGDYVRKTGFRQALVALSGGVDSSLTAAIAVDALGPAQVTGAAMPSRYSSEGSVTDARAVAEGLGMALLTIPIEGPFMAFLEALSGPFAGREEDVTEENLQARIRGTLIMALSNKLGWLVLSTSNKSEAATGYTTLYGDMSGGLAVIQDVPKTLVYRLARYANVRAGRTVIPPQVIEKPPSAELRPDQRDEESLMPYARLDPILQAFVEEDSTVGEIVAAGYEEAEVRRVLSLVTKAEYKRRQAPPGLKITARAFGKDRRFPIANRYREF